MLFGLRRSQPNVGNGSFADGFLDGYHTIQPNRDPDRIPFRPIPLGFTPYRCGFQSGRERAVLDKDTDTDTDWDDDM